MKRAIINTIVVFIGIIIWTFVKGERMTFADGIISFVIIGIVMCVMEKLWIMYDKRN